MFMPQPVNAQALLKDRKDPPKAVDWWPTASYISCDGKLAVNTGGWQRPDGSVGYFSTVWRASPMAAGNGSSMAAVTLKVARRAPRSPRCRAELRRQAPKRAITSVAGDRRARPTERVVQRDGAIERPLR